MLGPLPALTRVDFVEVLGIIRAEEFRGLHSLARVKVALGYKACRSAIMIGDALNLAQMTQVVRNLATLVTPWVQRQWATLPFIPS